MQNVISGGGSANPVFGNVGNTDQRSKIGTFDIAPTYTRTIGDNSVFNFGPYVRKDSYNYYPSSNPLTDLGPLQTQSIIQSRSLTNAGVHSDLSYVKGIHNIKIGANYSQTFLRESDTLGLVEVDVQFAVCRRQRCGAARVHRSIAVRERRPGFERPIRWRNLQFGPSAI